MGGYEELVNMKYSFETTSRFRSSLKKVCSYRNFKKVEYDTVIALLLSGERLPFKYKNHKLHGNMQDFQECHISNDIVLIYKYNNDALVLLAIDIGSHSDLF